MKEKLKAWSFKKHAIMSMVIVLIILAINILLPYLLIGKVIKTYVHLTEGDSQVVGVIGGSDGPTAIFLSSSLFEMKSVIFNIYSLTLAFLLLLYLPILYIKKK